MEYSLIVIDMQRYFSASRNHKVQEACKKAIRTAMRDRATIVFVEYADCGRTLPALTDITKSYPNTHFVIKEDDDGSSNVLGFLRHMKLPKKHIKVCGVNTDACVYETTRGLKDMMSRTKFEVIADACNSCGGGHEDGLYDLKMLGAKLVNIVKPKRTAEKTRVVKRTRRISF